MRLAHLPDVGGCFVEVDPLFLPLSSAMALGCCFWEALSFLSKFKEKGLNKSFIFTNTEMGYLRYNKFHLETHSFTRSHAPPLSLPRLPLQFFQFRFFGNGGLCTR